MKAVALVRHLPITDPESLVDVTLPDPVPTGQDILVRVAAVSVNPVDTKQRAAGSKVEAQPLVLGWDAAGTVAAVGLDSRHDAGMPAPDQRGQSPRRACKARVRDHDREARRGGMGELSALGPN
jgi:NADPH:quinone reductase-like Zn-dependent oxidoreductase